MGFNLLISSKILSVLLRTVEKFNSRMRTYGKVESSIDHSQDSQISYYNIFNVTYRDEIRPELIDTWVEPC